MNINEVLFTLPLLLMAAFAVALLPKLSFSLFFKKRVGSRHARLGLIHLVFLLMGYIEVAGFIEVPRSMMLIYHIILGWSGVALTVTAAEEFQHKNVKNFASGTLDEHATVTHGEMIEHAFYQGINLVHILFIYLISYYRSWYFNSMLIVMVTFPWLFRADFPVNTFRDNYVREDKRSSTFVRFLYRIKKWQYVFYKHFVLHGLNIACTTPIHKSGLALYGNRAFRLFWILLNTAYVMEFFLQTLVKKGRISQGFMLCLQTTLIVASSLPAINVLLAVRSFNNLYPSICIISLYLNFYNKRYGDFINIMILYTCVSLLPYLLYVVQK